MTAATQQGRAWLALLLLVALLDVLTYAVAPQDAFDPFHPHAASSDEAAARAARPAPPRLPVRGPRLLLGHEAVRVVLRSPRRRDNS